MDDWRFSVYINYESLIENDEFGIKNEQTWSRRPFLRSNASSSWTMGWLSARATSASACCRRPCWSCLSWSVYRWIRCPVCRSTEWMYAWLTHRSRRMTAWSQPMVQPSVRSWWGGILSLLSTGATQLRRRRAGCQRQTAGRRGFEQVIHHF